MFHPQTDRQMEQQNQTLEQYLRSYVNYQQDDWARHLRIAEFAYNNSCHAVTGVSPFCLHTGQDVSMGNNDIPQPPPDIPVVHECIDTLSELRDTVHQCLQEASASQVQNYNKKVKPHEYTVSDLVWLSTKNIRTKQPSKKLDAKFTRPYKILEIIGKHTYHLNLPVTARVHPVFHVSLLEPVTGQDLDLAPLEVDGELE